MKKTLWMLGVAVAALTSCTESEVVEIPQGRAIRFDSFVNKETRTTITAVGELTNFYVYGANITTDNEDIKDDENTQYTPVFDESEIVGPNWEHSTESDAAAWANDRIYRFAAYTNGNSKCGDDVVSFHPHSQSLTFTDYEVEDKDLLVAVAEERVTSDDVSAEQKVALNFEHMLSRLKFTFTNNSNTNPIEVEDIVLTIYNEGTGHYDLTNKATWDFDGKTQSQKTFEGQVIPVRGTPNNGNTYQIEHYVIPQSSSVEVTIKYNTMTLDGTGILHSNGETGQGENVSLIISGDEWKAGYVYNYTAKLDASTKKIVFYVHTLQGWTNESPDLDI